ncbi:hypothetical protein NM688_g2817 [Phlebia brevispora]|uniref:Uncharacterized protein n=1 Tax=Phlebia brevispora TaxID=194682 RepID=A0ACC1T7F3_9APHY|nr:hypothetical protein NM688_g2817 [Phlebia brevispora]
MSVVDNLHQLKHNILGSQHAEPTAKESSSQTEDHVGLSHKIKDVLDGGEERRKREEQEEQERAEKLKDEARKNVEAQRGLASQASWILTVSESTSECLIRPTLQIHDALDGGKCKSALEHVEYERLEAQAQAERKKHDDITDKLHDALEAPSELHQKVHELIHGDEKVEQQTVEKESLGGKMKALLQSDTTDDAPEKAEHRGLLGRKDVRGERAVEEGWSEKLHALPGFMHKEEKKPEQGWLMEKTDWIRLSALLKSIYCTKTIEDGHVGMWAAAPFPCGAKRPRIRRCKRSYSTLVALVYLGSPLSGMMRMLICRTGRSVASLLCPSRSKSGMKISVAKLAFPYDQYPSPTRLAPVLASCEMSFADLLNDPNGNFIAEPSTAPAPSSAEFELGDFAIDDYRPLKIIGIGAGMSGILAAIRFRQYIHHLDLTIYEKQDNVGGTWYVNRYPGVACDVPSHCYQYSFERKSDWSALYSPGHEILGHLEDVVARYKLEPYIHLKHEMVSARYDEENAKWHVTVKRPSATVEGEFEEFEDSCDFLFMGTGILSRWDWPDIPGLKSFKGVLVHSADWRLGGKTWEEDVKDWKDKNVAVIGLGSSGLQIVSALQDKVGKLTQYVRGKTWVAPPFVIDKMSNLLNRELNTDENYTFTEEEKAAFTKDPVKAAQFRQALEDHINCLHPLNISGTKLQQEAQAAFREHMQSALKPEIAEKLIPNFSVSVRRITPAPGYLKALGRDNVRYETSGIKAVTPEGIETEDGTFTKHDVIICATGWDVSYRFPFSMYGRNGTDIRDKWNPFPRTYLSVAVDEFPNCFFACGPNSCIGTSSFLPMIEHEVGFAVQAAIKLQRERIKTIEVKPEAVADFDETVFAEPVRSWYKAGAVTGRVVGLWPGSGLHCMRALKNPRWEDFNYEYVNRRGNRLHWLGNGMTYNEVTLSGNRAWFLDDDYVDVPPVPQ